MLNFFKPTYKKNCNWCRYLRFGVISDIAECTITGEKILFKEVILNNKTCEKFKCCDSSRTKIEIIRDYFNHLKANWIVAGKAILLFIFHFLHGLIPCKFTEHEYWNLRL